MYGRHNDYVLDGVRLNLLQCMFINHFESLITVMLFGMFCLDCVWISVRFLTNAPINILPMHLFQL